MDESAAETHLSVLWGGDENHPDPDLSGTWTSNKRRRSCTSYVDLELNRQFIMAVSRAEAAARLENGKIQV